ncbi:MAG: carbon-nitrogen hydrolase family protein [Bdellovibrionales bacterium]|nr:carbon-nitrogen hydrolase family protein [Bdellovibrionales bacterium]
MKIAVVQLNSSDDINSNLKNICDEIQEHSSCDLICFPENSIFMRSRKDQKIAAVLDEELTPVSSLAKEYGVGVLLGSVARGAGKPKSTTIYINEDGDLSEVYSKVHMFDVKISGDRVYQESDDFTSGTEPKVLSLDGWKWGLNICFDLRFSEQQLQYYKKKVDVLFFPSAFTVATGRAHWEVLLRSRAIEGQCFVVAPAQVGDHGEGRKTWGHSMVIDPWGRILNEIDGGVPGAFEVQLERELLDQARAQIPMYH